MALGSLPSGLAAGTASSVEVTITDSGLQRTAPLTLSGLSGSTSRDGSDFGGTLDIGTFAPGTTEYAATVGNTVTHVKLTATAGEPGATLTVGTGSPLAAVADGTASGAIPLSVGANALKVEVTAEDGTVTTYTVTVTREERALSSDATLSGLSAEAKTEEGWSALDVGTFASATTAYAATVPNGDDARAADGGGGGCQCDAEGGRGLEPGRSDERDGERRDRAQRGRQRAQGRGDGRGRHDPDVRGGGDASGGAADGGVRERSLRA